MSIESCLCSRCENCHFCFSRLYYIRKKPLLNVVLVHVTYLPRKDCKKHTQRIFYRKIFAHTERQPLLLLLLVVMGVQNKMKSTTTTTTKTSDPPFLGNGTARTTNVSDSSIGSSSSDLPPPHSKQTIIPSGDKVARINFSMKGTDAAADAAASSSRPSTKGNATGSNFASFTEETSSEGAMSTRSSDNGQAYEVIEYDYDEDANIIRTGNNLSSLAANDDGTSELLAEVVGKTAVINIDDDSPAAEALRANAKIHVSSVGKAARAVQLQSVRRVLKRATGITKSGNKKGKPPRIPPALLQMQQQSNNIIINNNNVLMSPGPIDVDQYIDAGEMTDHSNNKNQDILVEGIDEDNADDDDDDIVNHSITSNEVDIAAILHQHGMDEPSFSETNGDDMITGVSNFMDESRNSRTSNKTTTSGLKSPPLQPTTTNEKALSTPIPIDRDMMHIPDGVAPGTVEAGKKGWLKYNLCCCSEMNPWL
jgi:hypothetical protein